MLRWTTSLQNYVCWPRWHEAAYISEVIPKNGSRFSDAESDSSFDSALVQAALRESTTYLDSRQSQHYKPWSNANLRVFFTSNSSAQLSSSVKSIFCQECCSETSRERPFVILTAQALHLGPQNTQIPCTIRTLETRFTKVVPLMPYVGLISTFAKRLSSLVIFRGPAHSIMHAYSCFWRPSNYHENNWGDRLNQYALRLVKLTIRLVDTPGYSCSLLNLSEQRMHGFWERRTCATV